MSRQPPDELPTPLEARSAVRSQLHVHSGQTLALHDWACPGGRAHVLLVHGLGEHAGRYAALAHTLNRWGYAVRSYDQQGHGLSTGARGGITHDDALLDDLADVLAHTRSALPAGQPLILLGHSLGGLVAARFVSRLASQFPQAVDALVLSSPALDPGLNALQKLLLATLPRVLPDLRVNNGLNARFLSHDAAVVAAYRADPLVHAKVSGRLARFIATAGPATVAAAAQWTVPTLLLYAGADRLVSPAGSRAFAAASASAQARVAAHEFAPLFHEIFNESPSLPETAQVFATLQAWLQGRPQADRLRPAPAAA